MLTPGVSYGCVCSRVVLPKHVLLKGGLLKGLLESWVAQGCGCSRVVL
jgi:hypothetical protein